MGEIFFAEEKNGYDKTQVDGYIQRLTDAYQKAYNEYLATCDKYNALMMEYKKLESEKQTGTDANIIARTLINAEKLAQKIIDNAYNEEARISEQIKKNIELVYNTMEKAIGNIQKISGSELRHKIGGDLNVQK